MSARQIPMALAAVLVVAGLVLGFRTVSSNGVGCGSAFSPSSADADAADSGELIGGTLSGATPDTDTSNNADACSAAVGDAKPLAYGSVGLGVLSFIASLVAPKRKPRDASSARK